MLETSHHAPAPETLTALPLPELLSPAGDFEKLEAAIRYGADAVYLAGESFGLRAFSGNFNLQELSRAIVYAHAQGVRVYQTINILAHPGDMAPLRRYLEEIRDTFPQKPDAFIISDPGVFDLAGAILPEVERHISTQASICNAGTAKFWHRLGASRVILARELSLAEIRQIRTETPPELELEAFVHGAMCMAYSGRCLLSNLLTGRGGNQGACAQPCRWRYSFTEEKRDEPVFDVAEDERGSYFFSSADLCMIEHLRELQEAGITSLKIEGRMKGAYYAAMTTRAYRQALDELAAKGEAWRCDPVWLEELEKLSHRRYATGFYYVKPGEEPQLNGNVSYRSLATVVGLVKEVRGTTLVCEQRNKILRGEALEVVSPGPVIELPEVDLRDETGAPIDAIPHPQATFEIHGVPEAEARFIVPGSFLRRLGPQQI